MWPTLNFHQRSARPLFWIVWMTKYHSMKFIRFIARNSTVFMCASASKAALQIRIWFLWQCEITLDSFKTWSRELIFKNNMKKKGTTQSKRDIIYTSSAAIQPLVYFIWINISVISSAANNKRTYGLTISDVIEFSSYIHLECGILMSLMLLTFLMCFFFVVVVVFFVFSSSRIVGGQSMFSFHLT